MNTSDELISIVRRARERDVEALEQLVDLYAARLHGFVFRMTGRVDDAEELVQEVFVRLVKSIHAYEEDGRFEAWLFRIAANLVRDQARRGRRSPIVGHLDEGWNEEDGHHQDVRTPLLAAQDGPDRGLVLTEEITRLQTALDTLPVEEREVVMLRHYTDLSFAEIAALMGTPLGTALARSHRGLAKLRKIMEVSP